MQLGLVLLIVGICFATVTCEEGYFERDTATTKRCSSRNISMRTRVVELYTDLNESCGLTATTISTTTTTTTSTTPIPCSVVPELEELHVLYSSSKSDHFYVTTDAEVTDAVANTYTEETSPGKVTSATTCPCGAALSPVYRLVNANSNDHFYTAFKEEADNAVTNYGYTEEGIKFYCSLM